MIKKLKSIEPSKANKDRAREYRLHKKLPAGIESVENAANEVEYCKINHTYTPPPGSLTDIKFNKQFTSNPFGLLCLVCDHL